MDVCIIVIWYGSNGRAFLRSDPSPILSIHRLVVHNTQRHFSFETGVRTLLVCIYRFAGCSCIYTGNMYCM